jgi:phosphoglycerate dehydrogenase-like enzyme
MVAPARERLPQPEAPVNRPGVLVFRASEDDPPPGIEPVREMADLSFAPDPGALAERIGDAEILYSYRASPSSIAEAFSKAGRLRWIQAASAGVDGLLFPELVDSEVLVTNARGVFDEAIAEWALGAMLSFATGIVRSLADQRDHRWTDDRRKERLAGSRLVVVGPGPVGRATARLARAAGMEVEAVGTRERRDDVLGPVAGPGGFHAALGRADYVVDALPLTAATRHRFDGAAFTAMSSGARFLNVGRGATVDEPVLITALVDGLIAGAALDVFEEEPLPSASPLWSMPNVIVSPHICGDFEGWEREVTRVFVDNLARFVRGEPLRNRVDKALGYATDW